jgi:predicted nucleic acid-binding protein
MKVSLPATRLATKADALVTGDADLLVLAPVLGLAIITPAQAVE